MSFYVTLDAATVGSVTSAYVLYVLGSRLGAERAPTRRRVPLTNGEDVHRAADWFARHGDAAVFTCRFVPLSAAWSHCRPVPRGGTRSGSVC